MSSPDPGDEIFAVYPATYNVLPYAIKHLRSWEPLQTLLGGDLGADPTIGDAYNLTGWIFQALDSEGRPTRDVEGTGSSAIVLSYRDDWAAPNRHNSAVFPSLQVLIYADSTRNEDGDVIAKNAVDRCRRVFEAMDGAFHDPANVRHQWPEDPGDYMPIVSCVRASGLSITDVPGSDYVVRGLARYDVVLG